jgi:hypothetical protein
MEESQRDGRSLVEKMKEKTQEPRHVGGLWKLEEAEK